jgi:hypothetical protein
MSTFRFIFFFCWKLMPGRLRLLPKPPTGIPEGVLGCHASPVIGVRSNEFMEKHMNRAFRMFIAATLAVALGSLGVGCGPTASTGGAVAPKDAQQREKAQMEHMMKGMKEKGLDGKAKEGAGKEEAGKEGAGKDKKDNK